MPPTPRWRSAVPRRTSASASRTGPSRTDRAGTHRRPGPVRLRDRAGGTSAWNGVRPSAGLDRRGQLVVLHLRAARNLLLRRQLAQLLVAEVDGVGEGRRTELA